MSYFDIDPRAADDLLAQARRNPAVMPTAGAFDGAATAPFKGLMQGVIAQPALLLGDAVTPAMRPVAKTIDEIFGGSAATDWLEAERQKNVAMVKRLMPDESVGLVGQLGYGAGAVLPQAIAGTVAGGPAGGAAVVGALQGYAKQQTEIDKGVDPLTATGVGAIEGVTQAAGVFLPGSVGAKVLPSIAVGAGGNVALGVAQRAATSELLERRGYADMAKQYQAFDSEAMAIDVVLGAAFGVLGAKMHPGDPARVPQQTVDAALAANAKQHVEVGVAPGIPVNPESITAHSKAVNQAMADLAADRPVDVSSSGVADAEFTPARSDIKAAVQAAVEELHPLGKALDDLDELRAKAREMGLEPPDEPIMAGRKLPGEDPPKAAEPMGRKAEVYVGERAEPVRFQVVEADSLTPAMAKGDNQFRDRSRAASQLQISKIASDLKFGLLADSPTMADGAPTISRDGQIIGGNGRVAAVRQAYEQGGAGDYRLQLENRASEFGLDPESVKGMKNPVLIRQFENQVDVRKTAIQSNEGGGLRMSALEQAKVDAERMPSLADVEIPDSGDLNSAGMAGFVRQWMGGIPADARGDLIAADGKLSASGIMRLRNGMLFKAYGDSPTLARLVESTDEAQKNVANALVKASANVAEAREMIAAGDLHDLDIQPQLLQAVEKFAELRASGLSVDKFVDQGDMFGTGIGGEAVALMRHMEENKRSTKAITEAVTGYYDAVRALGDPKQGSMFDTPPPSRAEVLSAVLGGRKITPETSLIDGVYGGKIEASTSLSPEHSAVESRFAAWILEDVDRAVTDYAKHPETNGGKILNTDIARDLSRDYNATKDSRSALSAAVHEPASWLVKEMYRRKLAESAKAGEDPVVSFTAGGTGAGKSSAVDKVTAVQALVRKSQIVYDTNMNTWDSAVNRIEQALEAGKSVNFVYVARDPVVALTQGALPRAMRQGRTVPLAEHAKTHIGATKVAQRLAEKYKDHPNVVIKIIDNTGPHGSQYVADIAMLKEIDYNGLEGRLKAALESEYKNGKITEPIYRGTIGGDAKPASVRASPEAKPGDVRPGNVGDVQAEFQGVRGSDGREYGGEPAGPIDSGQLGVVGESTSQILSETPNASMIDDTGTARTAALAIADADAKITQAEKDSTAFPAAVACALRAGI